MPIIDLCTYNVPFIFRGAHLQTVGPRLFRPVPKIAYRREPLLLPDGDTVALDWLPAAVPATGRGRRVAVVLHGLEGDSQRSYMRAMALCLHRAGWDCAALNARGCGGGMNSLPRLYHCGETEDLHSVLELCRQRGYAHMTLVGFSMGGNQVLKYLGENPERVPREVSAAVAISVPCDLEGGSEALARPENYLYMQYFLRTLRRKVRQKHARFPSRFPVEGLDEVRTFAEFDDRYTAPLHGFSSALDYWRKASSLRVLPHIRVPTLLVNARNDPFLSPGCYPDAQAAASGKLFFLAPREGGHVGFPSWPWRFPSWLEEKTIFFIETGKDDEGLNAL